MNGLEKIKEWAANNYVVDTKYGVAWVQLDALRREIDTLLREGREEVSVGHDNYQGLY